MSRKNFYYNNMIFKENWKNDWFKKLQNYITLRYNSIDSRLQSTFRFLELHPNNKDAFSYEYSSILRDVGSVFSSVMDGLLRNLEGDNRYNIDDYRKYLLSNISDLEIIYIELNMFENQRFIHPYQGFSGEKHKSKWWTAFINIKHFDYECMNEGCLSNVMYAYGALAVLEHIMNEASPLEFGVNGQDSLVLSIFSEQVEKENIFPYAQNPNLELN